MKKFLLLLALCVVSACNPPPAAHTFGAAGGTTSPIIPASWTVPAWFVDPANSSGTASDNNNCTTSATACLTWHEINDHRWGCQGNPVNCPRLRQNTTVTFTSSQGTNQDPVYFYPSIENGSVVILAGSLGAGQQIASGVLSNVTAKNRATPQLLLAQSGATAVGQLVVNSTHPSRAWTYLLSSGSIYKMTEPSVAVTVPTTTCGTGVDTWANGDSVIVYQPVLVNLVSIAPTFDQISAGFSNYTVYIQNIAGASVGTTSSGFDLVSVKNAVYYESSSSRTTSFGGPLFLGMSNCNSFFSSSVRVFRGLTLAFNAGAVGVNGQISEVINTAFLNDAILAANVTVAPGEIGNGSGSGSGFGPAYIESTFTLAVNGPFLGTGGIWWGPGIINVSGSGRFVYTSTASTNLLVGTLQLNGGTTGHSLNTVANVDTPCGNITVNKANLDATLTSTCASTGFGGYAFNPGGGTFVAGTSANQ